MRTSLIVIISLFFGLTVNAQKIKLKKEIVYLDDEKLMKYESKEYGKELYLFEFGDEEESIFIRIKDATSILITESTYVEIHFPKTKQFMEVKNTRSKKAYVKWLLENKIINKNGELLEENIDKFIYKYDEKFTDR